MWCISSAAAADGLVGEVVAVAVEEDVAAEGVAAGVGDVEVNRSMMDSCADRKIVRIAQGMHRVPPPSRGTR